MNERDELLAYVIREANSLRINWDSEALSKAMRTETLKLMAADCLRLAEMSKEEVGQ